MLSVLLSVFLAAFCPSFSRPLVAPSPQALPITAILPLSLSRRSVDGSSGGGDGWGGGGNDGFWGGDGDGGDGGGGLISACMSLKVEESRVICSAATGAAAAVLTKT